MASKQTVLNYVMSFHGITGDAVNPIIDWYNSMKGTHIKYGSPWCAMFLGYVLEGSGYMKAFPVEAGCDAMKNDFKRLGRWYTPDQKKPQVGDIIFFSNKNTEADCTHVGIVMLCDYYTEVLTTYEGNTSKMVAPRMYRFTDNPYIVGYADIQNWYST